MAMIAASKLRRSQDAATQGRYYANSMKEMVSNVVSQIGDEIANQPLAQQRDSKNVGVLFITPDRGLTGGLNSNLMRALDSFMASQNIRIRLRAYDHRVLDQSARRIVTTAERTGAKVVGPVPLPTKLERFTVARSPFIDKDSQEHFEIRTHKRLIDVLEPDSNTIDTLMRLNLPAGVDIEIKI